MSRSIAIAVAMAVAVAGVAVVAAVGGPAPDAHAEIPAGAPPASMMSSDPAQSQKLCDGGTGVAMKGKWSDGLSVSYPGAARRAFFGYAFFPQGTSTIVRTSQIEWATTNFGWVTELVDVAYADAPVPPDNSGSLGAAFSQRPGPPTQNGLVQTVVYDGSVTVPSAGWYRVQVVMDQSQVSPVPDPNFVETLAFTNSKSCDLLAAEIACGCSNGEVLVKQSQATAGDPVNTGFGFTYETATDIQVPGRPTISATRSYSSTFAGADGPLGYGWSMNAGAHLALNTPTAGEVTVVEDSGAQMVFSPVVTSASYTGPTRYTGSPRVIGRLVKNADGTFQVTRADHLQVNFTSTGQLASTVDNNGYTTSYAYDGNGHLSTVKDAANRVVLTYTWVGNHVDHVTDAASRTVTYGYDGSGNLTDVTDIGGAHRKYGYDSGGHHWLTSLRDPKQVAAGVTSKDVVNEYDNSLYIPAGVPAGRVTRQIDNRTSPARITIIDYKTLYTNTDPRLHGVKITDPHGNVRVDYYTAGMRTSSIYGYGTPVAMTWTYTYASTGALTSATVASRTVIANTYDGDGNLQSSTDALGRVTRLAGYNNHRPTTMTDPTGVVTTFGYDAHGNTSTICTPLGTVPSGGTLSCGDGGATSRTVAYNRTDAAHPGDVKTVTDALNNTWSYDYDANGYPQAVTSPAPQSNKTTTVYDSVGRIQSRVSARGNKAGGTPTAFQTVFATNAYGDVSSVTDPLGHVETRHFDANHNVDWTRTADDPTGTTHQVTYGYDDANQLLTVTRPIGVLSNTYWEDGSLKSQSDGAGAATNYSYDPLGRIQTITDPARTTTYGYDTYGNLATRQDPGGNCNATPKTNCVSYSYDAGNQLTGITYTDPATPAVSAVTYDNDGRRTSMTDGTGQSTWQWDSLGRLTHNGTPNGSTDYTWDLRDGLKTVQYPQGTCATNDKCVTYGIDNSGRTTTVTDWKGQVFTYHPDEDSNYDSITYPTASGNVDSFTFDNADRLMAITAKKATTTLASQTLGRTNAGLLSSNSQTGLPGAATPNYGYNGNDQLCYVAGAAGTNPTCASPPAGAQKYTFDAADNLTQQLDGTIQKMDPANQLCYTAPSGTTPTACTTPPTGATTYGYDARGNRTTKTPPGGVASTYTYNQANRLTGASVASTGGATGQYSSVTPARIVDSTNGTGIPAGQVAPGATATIQVTGQGGIPATGATAVALELTTANQTSASCLTAYPSDQAAPTAANLCYTTNKPISNLAIVKPGADGKIKILNAGFGATDLFVDTQGWYGAGTGSGSFNALTPARIADTRPASNVGVPAGQIPANGTLLVPIAGQGGIPTTGVASVTANVSVLNATGTGFVVAYPADVAAPNTRTVSYTSGQPMSGLDNVKIATGTNAGKIKITNTSTTPVDVVVDVQGWTATTASPTGAGYQPVAPARVYDSRSVGAGTAFAAGETRSIQIAGQGGVPATGATSVAVTITALGQSGVGYLTAYQTGTTIPATANLVYPSNQAASNMAIVSVSPAGQINLTNLGFSTTQAVIDISGYYTTDTASWTYAYNGTGLRQSKSGPPSRPGLDGTTKFNWGAGSVPELLVETNTATTGNQPDITRYVYGPDGLPVEQITSINGGADTVTLLHHDQQGSTVLATNASGATVGTWAYDPYGNVTAATGTTTITLGYDGEYRDAETGFIYLRNRYYDPTTGQFLSRDPLTPLTRSAYGYVSGNPLNSRDPSGLWSIDLPGGWCYGNDDDCHNPQNGHVTPVSQPVVTLREHLVVSATICELVCISAAEQQGTLNLSWGAIGVGGVAPTVGWANKPVAQRNTNAVGVGGAYGLGVQGSMGSSDTTGSLDTCDWEVDLTGGVGGYIGVMHTFKSFDIPIG